MKLLTRDVPPDGVPARGSGAVQETIFLGIVFLLEFAWRGGEGVASTCVGFNWEPVGDNRAVPGATCLAAQRRLGGRVKRGGRHPVESAAWSTGFPKRAKTGVAARTVRGIVVLGSAVSPRSAASTGRESPQHPPGLCKDAMWALHRLQERYGVHPNSSERQTAGSAPQYFWRMI